MQHVYLYKEGCNDNPEGENVTYVFADLNTARAYLEQRITSQFGCDFSEVRKETINASESPDYVFSADHITYGDRWWFIDEVPVRSSLPNN